MVDLLGELLITHPLVCPVGARSKKFRILEGCRFTKRPRVVLPTSPRRPKLREAMLGKLSSIVGVTWICGYHRHGEFLALPRTNETAGLQSVARAQAFLDDCPLFTTASQARQRSTVPTELPATCP
jgi:hypothetical protein